MLGRQVDTDGGSFLIQEGEGGKPPLLCQNNASYKQISAPGERKWPDYTKH